MDTYITVVVSVCLFFLVLCSTSVNAELTLYALYPTDEYATTEPGGRLKVESNKETTLLLVGSDLTNSTLVYFTPDSVTCQGLSRQTRAFTIFDVSPDRNHAYIKVTLPPLFEGENFYHICSTKDHSAYSHHGTQEWLTISVFVIDDVSPYLLPLGIQIVVIFVLLVLSGLFSGLNLGLMALDQTELQIIERVGSPKERAYAKKIAPLRKRGNLLLCTLLLGNVMVNSTFTILFDNLTNGLIAVISSTIGIVVFGEIIPQAICSRHGLAVGAKTYWLTRFFMVVTFPASFPISIVLDKILGEEMGQVYNKEKLQELIRMTADRRVLHDNEANIISGALQLTSKTVEDVMTKIEDVYMLSVQTVMDFETLTEILRKGYTRVPVYDGEKTNIVNLLNTKDLALIDPDDKTLLSTVCKFYDHKPLFVDYDLTLDAMLQEFLQGNSHMAIVSKLHNTEDQDPYFENVGVITLEDVIEEILQSEIVDETDERTDNRKKLPLRNKKTEKDYELFSDKETSSKLPKQLAFVAFQFLTTTVEPFSDDNLARNVVKNLMKKDIVMSMRPSEHSASKNYIFEKGVPSDMFVLILQGTVEVTIGEEGMTFESGPFTYFGTECLNCLRHQSDGKVKDYIPDFSVRAVTDVQYLCIRRSLYLAALRTTRMIRQQKTALPVGDAFDAEYERLKRGSNFNNSTPGLESQSPPKATLEILKHDELQKKQSTSSLDRLSFFNRRHDVADVVQRLSRSGSDAKDRPAEIPAEMDSLKKKNVRKLSEDGGRLPRDLSPASGDVKKRSSYSALPFSNHSNHKLDSFVEDGETTEDKAEPDGVAENTPLSESRSPVKMPPMRVDSSGFDVGTDKASTTTDEFVAIKQPSSPHKEASSRGVSDSERIPLMDEEESASHDLTAPSTDPKL